MNYDQASQQAQQQGQAAQQQLDKQSALTQQQYQQQYGTTQDIQKQQQDYLKSIQEGGAQAEGALNRQYQQLGINPQAIAGANQQIAQTQTALQNVGQAAQQVGGGYGMTAGGQAQALSNLQGNLTGVLNAQANQANALSAQMGQALQNATLVEQSQLTSQEQKLKGYSDLFSSANQLLAVSSDTMNKVQTLAQQQGYVTAQQVQAYQSAKNQAAQAGLAGAQARLAAEQLKEAQSTFKYNQNVQAEIDAGKRNPDGSLKTTVEQTAYNTVKDLFNQGNQVQIANNFRNLSDRYRGNISAQERQSVQKEMQAYQQALGGRFQQVVNNPQTNVLGSLGSLFTRRPNFNISGLF